jgi:hypothetical protein
MSPPAAQPGGSGRTIPIAVPRLLVLIASLSVVCCGAIGVSATTASAISLLPACASTPTSTPFTPWGDGNSYFLMPGGGFESGAPGWTLGGGTAVADGNESFFVNDAGDAHSLALPGGVRVVSPTACVARGENTIRLFVKNPGVASSTLHVQAYVQNPLTGLVLSTGYDIRGTAGPTTWAPTSPLFIPNLLGGVLGTQNLTLVFTTNGTPANWGIDDVYVDPFKSR